jgi:sigma54-dependent transcription regulator
MSKTFDLSEERFLVVKKDEIRLFDDGSNKWATFNYSRWAHFVGQFAEIDESVAKLTAGQQDVKLQLHVGGDRYVSVISGF